MATRPRRPATTTSRHPAGAVGPSSRALSGEYIALRAYEIYRRRGGTDGADLDDWLQAERELRGSGKETASGDTARR